VEHNRELTPTLTHLYRQSGDEMAEVRAALGELREGNFREAFARLERDGRVHRSGTTDPYDEMVREWYAERQLRTADPTRLRSPMAVDRRAARHELNERARALLESDGSLRGPKLVVGHLSYRAGDEVLARITDRELVAPGRSSSEYVRNGSFGIVVGVGDETLDVAFHQWGTLTLPANYLASERNGAMALEHAYAITTYLAQGSTFASAITLVTDESRPDSVYVGATRGRSALHIVTAESDRFRAEIAEPELPVLIDERDEFEAAIDRLEASEGDHLASEWEMATEELTTGPRQIVRPR